MMKIKMDVLRLEPLCNRRERSETDGVLDTKFAIG